MRRFGTLRSILLPKTVDGNYGFIMKSVTIPLLHDNHNHASLYAALSSCHDISALDGRHARDFLAGLPKDRLSVVRGWRTNELPLGPVDLASLPPVLLLNFSLHGFAVSDAGLPYLSKGVPQLAERRNDPDWCEANVPALFAAYCDLAGISTEKLAGFLKTLEPLGFGSADDMAAATVDALDAIRSPGLSRRIPAWVAPPLFRSLNSGLRAACSGVKLFLDGALGSRSAAIAGPWIGAGKARFTYGDEELTVLLEEISGWDAAVAVHAIGELAIEQILRALEALGKRGVRFPLVRLEHVQLITREQAFRVRDLGATLSMQPNFSSDTRDYADRLPKSYLEANNPFRMLIDQAGFVPGKDLIFGSDGMPSGIAYAATEAFFPDVPGQLLTLDELVAGYGPSRGISGTVRLSIDESSRCVTVAGTEIEG